MKLRMAGAVTLLGWALLGHPAWAFGLAGQQRGSDPPRLGETSATQGQRSATARKTSPDALQEKLDRGERVLVIDVRSEEEVATGSIPGAIHIPLDQLEARLGDVPKDVQLVFT